MRLTARSRSNPYLSPAEVGRNRKSARPRRLIFALLIGLACNLAMAIGCYPLLVCSRDAILKPLFGDPATLLGAAFSLFVGLPLACSSLRRAPTFGAVAIILNLMPIPLCNLIVHWIVIARGLVIEG